MKRILILSLSALILLTGCRSGEEGAPDGMKTASPKEVSYILYVPEDWTVDTAAGSIMTAAHADDGDTSNITMMTYTNDRYAVGGEDDEQSVIDAYWQDYRENLPAIFDKDDEGNSTFRMVKTVGENQEELIPLSEEDPEGEKSELDGEDCVIYRYTGDIAGIPLYYLQVIAYRKGDFYIFTYTATTENDRHLRNDEDVGRILEEFKFK